MVLAIIMVNQMEPIQNLLHLHLLVVVLLVIKRVLMKMLVVQEAVADIALPPLARELPIRAMLVERDIGTAMLEPEAAK